MKSWCAFLVLVLSTLTAGAAGGLKPGWVKVRYGELVDRRELTHSGEAVSGLLRRLDGRPMPAGTDAGARKDDRLSHVLLEPVLEKYAFVMSDALDAGSPPPEGTPPWYEIAGLWEPGEAEPAWVELLRSRVYLVESDGMGRLRVCLPVPEGIREDRTSSTQAAEAAWKAGWGVLRHVFRSEQARLTAASGKSPDEAPLLDVEIHPYRHLPARSMFLLGMEPVRKEIRSFGPEEGKPSLDFDAWRRFLAEGRSLEGARLEPDGSIRFLSSESGPPARILASPLTLADMAVAYRAVFHGGAGEPYMSLDRGFSPQTTLVHYGGRLRDTRLGMVALLCDIRFKTISVGLDIFEGEDLREKIRKALPSFMTHVERFAADPRAEGVLSQQTRLWFYPDKVDMTLSPQADALLLRSVRMSAASERLNEAGLLERDAADRPADPPWTAATVKVVNDGYDTLAGLFPELSDLDQVVRLLSFFTWLKVAGEEGLPVPDLDALLAVELPSWPTPRTFPQMLAFNALPPAGSKGGRVDVFQRLEVGEGLDRMDMPFGRPLPAPVRLRRAAAWLDPKEEVDRKLQEEIARYQPEELDDASMDFYSYKAERIRMHRLVLRTLPDEQAGSLKKRAQEGEKLRMFSVGIGGLDLGMKRVFRRAASRSVLFRSAERGAGRSGGGPIRGAARPPIRTPQPSPVPARGPEGGGRRIESKAGKNGRGIVTLFGMNGPDARVRVVTIDGNGEVRFRRYEDRRRIDYRMETFGREVTARRLGSPASGTAAQGPSGEGSPLPPGTLVMSVGSDPGVSPDPARVNLTIRKPEGSPVAAGFPRFQLQRLVLGPKADPARKDTISGIWPLRGLGPVDRLVLEQGRDLRRPPWERASWTTPGEEDPWTLAVSMGRWASAKRTAERRFPAVAVGASDQPAGRWAKAPAPGKAPVLLLPEDGLPGSAGSLAAAIREAWKAGPVEPAVPARKRSNLVLLVSAEPSGRLGTRLRELARNPVMKGKALVVWALGNEIGRDLPAAVLAEGLGAFGLVQVPPVEWNKVPSELEEFSRAVAGGGVTRLQDLPAPILWFY